MRNHRLYFGGFCSRGHELVIPNVVYYKDYVRCRACVRENKKNSDRRKGVQERQTIPAIERFYSKVNKTTSCWLWTGATNNMGYPMFGVFGQNVVLAHRFSYEQFKGTIAPGMQIDHLCFNPLCVNPSHLEQVTNTENTQRAWDRRKQNV